MTESLPARSALRSGALFGLAGVLAAVAAPLVAAGPGLATPPAAAAQGCANPLGYGAIAQAELLRLNAVDLRSLGVGVGPITGVRVAGTASGFAARSPVKSAAAARSLDARLSGHNHTGGPLGTSVFQQAPPVSPAAATAAGTGRSAGALTVGTAAVSARATWADAMSCGGTGTGTAGAGAGAGAGENTSASARVAGAAILPAGDGRSLLAMPDAGASRTTTGLADRQPTASATISLTEIRLFAGTGSPITVRVVRPPTLSVRAGASPDVSYVAPILDITGPKGAARRLDAPGEGVEYTLPSESDPLGDLVSGFSGGNVRATAPAHGLELPGVQGLPQVAPADLTKVTRTASELPVVRLSVGSLTRRVSAGSVEASAVSLRVEVLAPVGSGAYGRPRTCGTLADVALGLLSTAAVTPGGTRSGDVESGRVSPGGSAGGARLSSSDSLPVTGSQVWVLAAVGALVLILGRLLLVLSRRRS